MKTIKSTDWQQFKMIGKINANPSQSALAYVVSNTDYIKDKYNHNIWVYQDHRHFQLTTFDKESNFVWLDDETILFTSTRKKDKKKKQETDCYCISILGGEASKVCTLPLSLSSMKVINANELLILAEGDARYADAYKASKEDRKKMVEDLKEQEYVTILNQIPFYSNGGTFTSFKRSRLYHYDISEDKLTPITDIEYDVEQIQLNQDKTKALLVGQKFNEVAKLHNELVEVDLKNFKLKKKTKTKVRISAAYYVNGEIIGLYTKDQPLFGLNENSKIGRLNEKAGTFDLIVDPVYSIGNSVGSDVRLLGSNSVEVINDQLVMTLNVNDHSRLIKLTNHSLLTICDWEGSIDGFAFCNNQWVIAGLLKQQPMELYTLDHHLLSNHNPSSEDLPTITPTPLDFEVDNRKLKGWVMLPPNYSAKKKYPAILNIHGGPKTIYGSVYVHEMQVWAHQGYIVMFTNPTGADGQDNSFSDIRGKYGTVDYEDLMGFVDALIKEYPAVDIKKLGVTGGSYGGFMTNWIIGHTDRFACAITQRSISNWTSFYGVSDIGFYFGSDQNQATLLKEADMEKMWWHSPIKYLSNMKTPTLIIHSNLDYRCPVEQGYQLFTGLKEMKVPTKMVLFTNENHDLSRNGKPKARQTRLDEMLVWFDKYLK
jgi:dipeptidyl aminopeptidase/acylaminoacyl peptidase